MATTFQDAKGDQWTIELTNQAARRATRALGINPFEPQGYSQLAANFLDQMAMVYLLVKPEADERDIDADEFDQRLQGEGVVDAASEALLGELHSLFQKYGQKKMVSVSKMAQTMLRNERERVESGELDRALEQVMTSGPG